MSEERIEEMNPLFYDAVFFNTVFLLARLKIKYIYKMMWMKIFYLHVITSFFFSLKSKVNSSQSMS